MGSVRVRILAEDDRAHGVEGRAVKGREDLLRSGQDRMSATAVRHPFSDGIKSLWRNRGAEGIGPVGRDNANRRPAPFRVHYGRV